MKVSVIMANYNTNIKYLSSAVNSILNQSFNDFEFIIIDDASTDNSLEYLRRINDRRVVLLENDVNLGLTKSLNKAIAVSKGKYIVRMDSDDISLPNRIEKQVQFMENHPNVIVAGTWVQYFGSSEILYKPIISTTEEYRVRLLFGNSPTIVHPSAILNKEMMLSAGIQYDERYRNSQDYKMWVECSKYGDCVIIPEVLLKYRVHEKQISSGGRKKQDYFMRQIVKEQLNVLRISLDEDDLIMHIQSFETSRLDDRIIEWYKKLMAHNLKVAFFSQKALERLLINKLENNFLDNLGNFDHYLKILSLMDGREKIRFNLRILRQYTKNIMKQKT